MPVTAAALIAATTSVNVVPPATTETPFSTIVCVASTVAGAFEPVAAG